MKTIGLIGGMSWESTLEYYRIINETVKARLGGLHSARCVLYSVDFADIEALQHQARWTEAGALLIDAAKRLERAGADSIVLCTNTMHKLAAAIQARSRLPLLHIADATAQAICARGLGCVGLLGTRFTMAEDFYTGRLRERYGLDILLPDALEQELVHRVIYDELCVGTIQPLSRARYLDIIERLIHRGAQGIILGCTEIGLLLDANTCRVPLFDTTRLHAVAAVDHALAP